MKKSTLAKYSPFLSVFLVACGGGGGGLLRPDEQGGTSLLNGFAIKGPLKNATVFADYNNDGVQSAGEPTATTGADGSFALTTTQVSPIVVKTGASTVDISTGASVKANIVLKAPSGATVITPATTLLAAGASEAQVLTALGLPSTLNLKTFNPFAPGVDASTALAYEKAAVQVYGTISAIASAAEGAGANSNVAFNKAFEALAEKVTSSAAAGTAMDLTNASVVQQVANSVQTKLAGSMNATAFQAASSQVSAAAANVNGAVKNLTDLTSNNSKLTIGLAVDTLGNQTKAATTAAVSAPTAPVTIGLSDSSSIESAKQTIELAPTDLALSKSTIQENADSLVVGTLTVTDANVNDIHTYVLSGQDADYFTLTGSMLSLKATANFEAKSSYSFTITTTDSSALSYSKDFSVLVGDVNEAPVLAAPAAGTVTEDASTSTVMGNLSAADPEGSALTYKLVNGVLSGDSYALTGTYGTLVLNKATGAYTYTLNNIASATNALGESPRVSWRLVGLS